MRGFNKLPGPVQSRIRAGLVELAAVAAGKGRIGGKKVKIIRGHADSFHRLRVGEYRVMYDAIDEDRVVLVLGIAHRGDLERWLRSR